MDFTAFVIGLEAVLVKRSYAGNSSSQSTDFDIQENFVLTYDSYKYVRPASGKAHWVQKWGDVVGWTRNNVVVHPNSKVRFDVPFALEEGYYVFELGPTKASRTKTPAETITISSRKAGFRGVQSPSNFNPSA